MNTNGLDLSRDFLVHPDYCEIKKVVSTDKDKMNIIAQFMPKKFDDLKENNEFTARLIFLGHIGKNEDIDECLKEKGCRAAVLPELLAFLKEYDNYKIVPMVAYGSKVSSRFSDFFRPSSQATRTKDDYELFCGCFNCCRQESINKFYFLGIKL